MNSFDFGVIGNGDLNVGRVAMCLRGGVDGDGLYCWWCSIEKWCEVFIKVIDGVASVADAIVIGIGDALAEFVKVVPVVTSNDSTANNVGGGGECLVPSVAVNAFINSVVGVVV